MISDQKQTSSDGNVLSPEDLTVEESFFLELLQKKEKKTLNIKFTSKGPQLGNLEPFTNYYNSTEILRLLESLVSKGAIIKQEKGAVLLCPKCGSYAAMPVLICPRCNSTKVGLKEDINHPDCEHWGPREDFVDGVLLRCPRCDVILDEKAIEGTPEYYSVSDPYFECQDCGTSVARNSITMICVKCNHKYTSVQSSYLNSVTYVLASGIKVKAKGKLPKKIKDRKKKTPQKEPEEKEQMPDDELPPVESLDDQEEGIVEPEPQPDEFVEVTLEEPDEADQVEEVLEPEEEPEDEEVELVDEPEVETNDKKRLIHLSPEPEEPATEPPKPEKRPKRMPKKDKKPAKKQKPKPEKSLLVNPMKRVTGLLNPKKSKKKKIRMKKPKPKPKREPEPEPVVEEEEEEIEEAPKSKSVEHKVLMIVENVTVSEFVIESLEKVKKPISVLHIDNGQMALKELRNEYDALILDLDLKTIEGKFILSEMERWNIMTPIIALSDEDLNLGKYILNVETVVKKKQGNINRIGDILKKLL